MTRRFATCNRRSQEMSQSPQGVWSRRTQPTPIPSAGRVSRRDLLRLLGLTAGTAAIATVAPVLRPAAAASLTESRPAGSTAAPTVRRQTDELVVAFSADPGHLDPRVEAGGIGW